MSCDSSNVGRVAADATACSGDFNSSCVRCPPAWRLVLALLWAALLATDVLSAPTITITSLPPFGVSGSMQGTVSDVDPSQYRVATFILVPGVGWFAKPTGDNPTVPINADGSWSANVDTGGMDTRATIYSAWLVPKAVPRPGAVTAPELPRSRRAECVSA